MAGFVFRFFIFAEPFAQNMRSCRVLEKAGFQYEGTLHNHAVKNGRILDMKMYALLKKCELLKNQQQFIR